MARKFSFPQVTTLEVGQSCVVQAPVPEVKRKCGLYGKRNRKNFSVMLGTASMIGSATGPAAIVTREADTPTPLMG